MKGQTLDGEASRSEVPPRARGPRVLDAPFEITHSISPRDVEALLAIRRRRDLVASRRWVELAPRVTDVTYALEYGRPARPAPRPSGQRFLRAITWNIERGNRLDALKGYFRSTPELRDADIVLLNEVDIGMARSGNRNVSAELAEVLGFEYVFGNSYFCLSHGDVRDGRPDGHNALGLHGNAILSRHPLRRAETFSVTVTRDKYESAERRLGHKKALWAEIDTPLGRVAAVSVHLDPYASPAQRGDQMADVLQTVERRGLGPVLLGGDLNTTTYDLESVGRLALNIGAKLLRGGFPHAIEHYMCPHTLYERPIFEALERHRFDVAPFNDMATGTVRYEVGTFDSESKVTEHLPSVFAHVLRYKLRPWGGVAPLKIDWFAGRGLEVVGEGRADEPRRRSQGPRVFERPTHADARLSDHDPLMVDFVPAGSRTRVAEAGS